MCINTVKRIIVTISSIVNSWTADIKMKGISSVGILLGIFAASLDTGEPGDLRIVPGVRPDSCEADIITYKSI